MKKNINLKNLKIAHRGLHSDKIPENTTLAFSKAIIKKLPIEFDIHILKDNNLVVFHDDDLKRLFNIDKKIEEYNYSELKKIYFPNTNLNIPLFSDVLKLVDGSVLLVIEIKKSNIINYKKYCDIIISILDKYKYDVVIKSFDIRIVSYFLKHTSYTTGLLIADYRKYKDHKLYNYLMGKKITLDILKPDFISIDYDISNKRHFINYRRKHPILLWTIRNKETLEKVSKYGDSYLLEKFDFS